MSPVTLLDGRQVDSDSIDYRDECLGRHVLAIGSRIERIQWLADFEKKHGTAAVERLKDAITRVHGARAKA